MNQEYPSLDLKRLQEQLAHSPIGHSLHYHPTVPSTMPIASALAKDAHTPSGVIVVAEEQTSGRGRRGRTWQAPYAGALLVSIILKPPHCHSPAALTMQAGNALLAAVSALLPEIADELRLKWPNDLVMGADPATARKIAGILAESSLAPDGSLSYAILGIGINVNQRSSDLPRIAPPTPRPTSLRLARAQHQTGEDPLIDRSALLVQLCQQLAEEVSRSPMQSYRQWKSNLATLGHTVAVYQQGVEQPATLSGQAVDVLEDGSLVVVDETDTRHTFHAADVSVRAA